MVIGRAVYRLAGGPRDGERYGADIVFYDGDRWLAPAWVAADEPGHVRPIRLFRLSALKSVELPGGVVIVSQAIPVALVEGEPVPAGLDGYQVIDNPPVIARREHTALAVEPIGGETSGQIGE